MNDTTIDEGETSMPPMTAQELASNAAVLAGIDPARLRFVVQGEIVFLNIDREAAGERDAIDRALRRIMNPNRKDPR
jgi:hypothetical protein